MTPEEVLARLAADLDVLDRPRRRAAPRHQSVRATIDWSYELLGPADRDLFARLSIFPGTFDGAIAHAVAGHGTEPPSVTQDRLDALVATSMVVADRSGPATQYRVLETLRAYGRERLDAAGVTPQLEARFVDHVVAQVTDVIARGASGWSSDALADLRGLYDSCAGVIRWCLDHDDEPGRAFLLVAALWGIVHQAHTEDVGRLAEAVLARWPGTDDPLRADAAATAATCRYMLGDLQGAVALAESALREAEHSPFAPATLRRAIAQARRADGDAEGALEWFAATEVQARRLGMPAMAMEALSARAQVLADLGQCEEGLALVAAVHSEAVAAGAEVLMAWTRVIEGSILLRVDPTAARTCLQEGLDACLAIQHHAGSSVARRGLVIESLLDGRVHDAATSVLELLEGLLALGSTYELRMALDVASTVAAQSGRRGPAAGSRCNCARAPRREHHGQRGARAVPTRPAGRARSRHT